MLAGQDRALIVADSANGLSAVLPFDNLRDDRSVDWLREGSVSMLGLNLSQWNDLTVVDHERLHDLLAKHHLKVGDDIGLDMARRLAREAGVWTVVLGDFTPAGDSMHLAARVFDVASGKRVDRATMASGAPSSGEHFPDTPVGRALDKRNFRRKMDLLGILQPLKEWAREGRSRPAQLFAFSARRFEKLKDKGILFPF